MSSNVFFNRFFFKKRFLKVLVFLPFRAFCVEGPQNLMFVRPCVRPSVCCLSVCLSRFPTGIGPIPDLSQFDIIASI